ncbi:MAG: hypothetical protein JXQ75_19840 [Phycisphaerae bacterium]|nr:hypothetical protein [Phycisphaerae bacterium]
MNDNNLVDVVVRPFAEDGIAIGDVEPVSANHPSPSDLVYHTDASFAMSCNGKVRVGWLGQCDDCHPTVGPLILVSDFDFGATPVPLAVPEGPTDVKHWEPSVGTSDVGVAAAAYLSSPSWWNCPGGDFLCEVSGLPAPIQIRTFDLCTDAQPCVAMRSDGYFCIVWAQPEDVGYNIALQLYDPTGVLIDEIAGVEGWVNDPDAEWPDSVQRSPAVALDDSGNIVVTWVGYDSPAGPGHLRVWARRLFWAGGPADPIVPVSNQFIVDSEIDLGMATIPLGFDDANPTVSLTLDDTNPGRFIIAWNVVAASAAKEIHGQYFETDGRPLGCEFRVNQDTSETGECADAVRQLADSAQHTLAYGPDDQVVATWTTYGQVQPCPSHSWGLEVYYTLLPGGYADLLDAAQSCLKGDTNYDGLVDGLDVQGFVDLLTENPGSLSIVTMCPADIDEDNNLDLDDLPLFVALLLEMR